MSGETDPKVFVHRLGLNESHSVGAGTRIWAFAHVMKGAEIGVDCNICDHAFVESGAKLGNRVTLKNAVLVWDGVTLEDEVFVGPNAVFTNVVRPRVGFKKRREEFGRTLVRKGASLGANSTILCGVVVGERAFVGAGAVVTKSIPDHGLVVGNPGRLVGWMCACGERLPDSLSCSCGRNYRKSEAGLRPA